MRTVEFNKLFEATLSKNPYLENIYSRKDCVFNIENNFNNPDNSYISMRIIEGSGELRISIYCIIDKKTLSDFLNEVGIRSGNFIVESPDKLFKYISNTQEKIDDPFIITFDELGKGNIDSFVSYLEKTVKIWENYTKEFDLAKLEKAKNNNRNTYMFPSLSNINLISLAYLFNNPDLENIMKDYRKDMRSSSDQGIEEFNLVVDYICAKKKFDSEKYRIKKKWYYKFLK